MKNFNKRLVSLGLSILTMTIVSLGLVPDLFAKQVGLPQETQKTQQQQSPSKSARQIFDEAVTG